MRDVIWRPMTADVVELAADLGDRVHLNYPESLESFDSKFVHSPDSCFVLMDGAACVGYALTHPTKWLAPPALDAILDGVPPDADCLHIHDVVINEAFRGRGLLSAVMREIDRATQAARYSRQSLIAVSGTGPVWARYGFTPCDDPGARAICRTYSETASYMGREL